MIEHGPSEWTNCAQVITGRNGKQCRERWVNILDPKVKIGSWSDDEQVKIFEYMKEHFTSWSSISKCLNGRTENSIKNYFYSTVRRIQSCKVFDYLLLMKQNKDLPTISSKQQFESVFQLNKLNNLGVVICQWLFNKETAKSEHLALYEYLMNTIADEKKKPKTKDGNFNNTKDLNDEDIRIEMNNGDMNSIMPDLINGKNLQGVHPLLPLALYGGFSNMNAKSLFQVFFNSGDQGNEPPRKNNGSAFTRIEVSNHNYQVETRNEATSNSGEPK